jgi:hypothetical protein
MHKECAASPLRAQRGLVQMSMLFFTDGDGHELMFFFHTVTTVRPITNDVNWLKLTDSVCVLLVHAQWTMPHPHTASLALAWP